MPVITIRRGSGWTDRYRSYAVFIDGTERGAIRRNETQSFEAPPGRHEVQLRIAWCTSPILAIQVSDTDVALDCGSNTIPGLAILSLARPDNWIWLRTSNPSANPPSPAR